MKTINFHTIAFAAILLALITFNWQYGNQTFIFFGFAENKEMEIRLEHPVLVQNIAVTVGSKVKKGDILLEVTRSSLNLTQSDLNHEVAKLESQLKMGELDIRATIRRLQAMKIAKQNEIRTQLEQLQSEMSINQSLVQGLESIAPAKDNSGRSPNEIRIEGLKKELRLAVRPIDAEIRKLKQELGESENPLKIQIEKLTEELGFVQEEEDKLVIHAPNDGVIGSIFCKVGEQLPAFTTFITFYEQNPTQVKAYVLENLMLSVNLGDSIFVHSSVQSGTNCMGKVIGMGSRIVEIPERLRKNPTFRTYGREIQIEIPTNNNFLQKEKVILKLTPQKEKIIQVLTPPSNTSNKAIVQKTDSEKL